ncbi:MAG: dihydroxy-acid dehydratase, partial [Myxococcota bacterium]|nr:dihydroxy-acid dehydratase [Myxococcota bacterium]
IAEGDIVSIDVDARTLDVDADLESRRASWTAPKPAYQTGAMAKYAYMVASASEGAITSKPDLTGLSANRDRS